MPAAVRHGVPHISADELHNLKQRVLAKHALNEKLLAKLSSLKRGAGYRDAALQQKELAAFHRVWAAVKVER